MRRVDHVRVGELGLDVADACLDEALALLGRVIFRVFRDIAVQSRLADRAHDRRPLHGFQLLQLGFKPLRAGDGHGMSAHL